MRDYETEKHEQGEPPKPASRDAIAKKASELRGHGFPNEAAQLLKEGEG